MISTSLLSSWPVLPVLSFSLGSKDAINYFSLSRHPSKSIFQYIPAMSREISPLTEFSSFQSEAVEAVRCLGGNKVTMETSAQQVVLSVRLNSTPRLPIQSPEMISTPRDFASVLAAGSGSFDPGTREWLVGMQKLVEVAEEDYVLTHDHPPEPAVFQPTISLEHLRRKENIDADELRRQRIITMISTEDQNLINLWDDDDDDVSATSSSTTAVTVNECETLFQSAPFPHGKSRFMSAAYRNFIIWVQSKYFYHTLIFVSILTNIAMLLNYG